MGEVKESDVDAKKEEGLVTCEELEAKPVSLRGRMTGPTRRSTKGGWTEEEDKILTFAVKKFSGKNWKRIAEYVPDRTDVQCLHRWQKVLNPNLVKGPWTKEEDDLIIELVGKHGNKKWAEIAKHLPGRIGKQCRERWHNHLNPEIKRTVWTKEEESTLIKCHEMYGNKWAEIAKFLPGRTENSIKNYWNCSVSKKLELSLAHGYDQCNVKAESKNSEVLNQRFESESTPYSCSTDLDLGNAEIRESSAILDKKDCRVPKKEAIDISKPLNRTIFCKRNGVAYSLTHGQFLESADTAHASRDLNHISANQPNELCINYVSDLSKSPYLQENHKPESNDLIYSFPSRMLSGPLPFSLNTPSTASGCNRNMSPPVNDKRLGNSCGRPQDTAYFKNYSRPLEKVEESTLGNLCYEPLQLKDLSTSLKIGTDNYVQNASGPITPQSDNEGISDHCQSPESIQRNLARLARTFKAPPIIMKRRFPTARQTGNLNYNDASLPKEKSVKSKSGCQSLHPHTCGNDDVNSMALSNAKQLFLSPPKSQKLETSAGILPVEQRLEYAFNDDQDSTRDPAAADSSGANCN